MIKLFIPIISLFLFQQCVQPQQTPSKQIKSTHSDKQFVDTTNYVTLSHDSIGIRIFKNSNSTTLSISDIIELEKILERRINEYNKEQQSLFDILLKEQSDLNIKIEDFVIELKKYKRQFIPVISEKGEKEVWVNCLCTISDDSWKYNLEIVKDGGNCYFNLIINLSNKSSYQLIVNDDV